MPHIKKLEKSQVTFDDCVEYILAFEGGFVADPRDLGGETNFGISKKAFPELDIRSITRNQAIEIYRLYYWSKCQCDLLPPYLRLMMFDCAVNQGYLTAVRLLQEAVKTTVDGNIGGATLRAAHGADPADVLTYFALKRHHRYSRSGGWADFGAGWSKRLLDVSLICALVI